MKKVELQSILADFGIPVVDGKIKKSDLRALASKPIPEGYKPENMAKKAVEEMEKYTDEGLPSCYKDFKDYMWDWWPNLPMTRPGHRAALEFLVKDPHSKKVADKVKSKFGIDILKIWQDNLKEDKSEASPMGDSQMPADYIYAAEGNTKADLKKIEDAMTKIAEELDLPNPRWKKEKASKFGDTDVPGRLGCELKYSPTAKTDQARKVVVVHFEMMVWVHLKKGKTKYAFDFRYYHKILSKKEQFDIGAPPGNYWEVSIEKVLDVLKDFPEYFRSKLKKLGYDDFEDGIATKSESSDD